MVVTDHNHDRLRTVGTWGGEQVDAGAILAHLTQLWRAAAERSRAGGEPAAARTNVLTLVVYAGSDATEQRAADAIAALVEHHPSRTILVRAEPSAAQPALAAEITTRCRVDRPQICHEQILLHARGAVVEQVSSAVTSLLLRDLPTFLWWPEDVRNQPELLLRLLSTCDRLIVDSATFADPAASYPALRGLLRQQRNGGVADMQWTRLTGWREVTAQFFDPASERPWLTDLRRVTLEVTTGGLAEPPASGLLYGAWLASRLGWQPVPNGAFTGSTLRLASSAAPVEVEVQRPDSGIGPPGQISAVTLHATREGQAVAFRAERQSADQVTTRVEGGAAGTAPAERTMRLPVLPDATLLSRDLGSFRRDRSYEESLDWLDGLYGVAGGKR